ncbi:MAG TPA: MarR family winged helix-turn-helix transcriptional regulator [Pseudonocardiaceae bacterium]
MPNPADATGRPRPDATQLAAWRAFLRAHAAITRCLERELVAEQQLSLAAYDVLVQLAEAPGRELRMTDLADAVLLSRSGVTRLVDRLERAGLVTRCRTSADGRGVVAVLTEAGLDRLRTAAGTHLAGIVRHFVDPLSPEELAALGAISARLTGPPADRPAAVPAPPAESPW